MKTMLMAVMAVAVAVTFSAPAFAGEEGKKKKEGSGHVVVYGEEKKGDKKGNPADEIFSDEKKEQKTKK
jgi:hypothetical protein